MNSPTTPGDLKRLLPFYLLAFLFSWAVWFPLLAAHFGWLADAPAELHLLGSLGPALAALLVSGRAGERATMWQKMTLWRVGWPAWLFAVGGPLVLLLFGLLVSVVLGADLPSWSALARVAEFPLMPLGLRLLAEIVFYGYGEEIGWRGFVLPRLERRFSPLPASVLLSLPWALWHLPLLLRNETYSSMNPALLGGWFFSLLTGAILMTWLYHLSQGSLLLLAVFHGLLDVVMVNEGVNQTALTAMGALVTVWGILATGALVQRNTPLKS